MVPTGMRTMPYMFVRILQEDKKMDLFFDLLLARPRLYLDPGSGSFLIQLLIAVALGVSVAVKMYWAKIKSFFGGKKSEPIRPVDENDEE
jgi:hypothetical protein